MGPTRSGGPHWPGPFAAPPPPSICMVTRRPKVSSRARTKLKLRGGQFWPEGAPLCSLAAQMVRQNHLIVSVNFNHRQTGLSPDELGATSIWMFLA